LISYSFIVIFFADFIYGLIPDEMEVVIVILTIIYNLQFSQLHQGFAGQAIFKLIPNFVVGLASALAFFLVVLATKFRGMGLGDVKLAFVMGFLLGWRGALVAFWFSFILGGIFAILLLMLRRKNFRETIALGPFMVLGTLIAALWSNKLLAILGF
jgi:prepilin signal peptidase PulO-like enzyme (type II secretory pathway)